MIRNERSIPFRTENAVIYGASYHFVFFLFLDAICFSVVLFGFVGHWEGHLT